MRVINYIRVKLKLIWPGIVGLFTKNLSRKLLSVLIALIIWIMAVNISNPEVTVDQTVNITVNYADALENADKTYTLETTTARVSYTIRSDNRSLVNASHFTAYINLIDYSVTGSVPVYVDVDPSVAAYVSDVTVRPLVVRVDTEDMVETSFDLDVNIDGSAAEGKAIGSLDLSSNQVTLYGPSSDVGRVASASITIPVNYSDSDISGVAEPVFYDSGGNELTLESRTQIRETISYTLHIYNTKRFAILAGYSGTPASGYSVSSVTCDPASLVVYGPDSLLELYSNINIPSSVVNVSGTTGNVAVLIDAGAYLPEGLETVDSGEVSIVANVVRTSTLPEGTSSTSYGSDESTTVDSESQTQSEIESSNQTESSSSTQSHTQSSSESLESVSSEELESINTQSSQAHSETSHGESRNHTAGETQSHTVGEGSSTATDLE